MAASIGYSPYSTVSNSYNQFMGPPASPAMPTGPYTSPIQNLRSGGDITNINTMGDMSPQQRIANRSQKEYEKWKASQMMLARTQKEFAADKSAALGGMTGVRYDNYSPAVGSPTMSAYDAFMSNQGVAGLLGGSVRPTTSSNFNSRSSDWNNAIANQSLAYQQAVGPVNMAYGNSPAKTGITPLW